MSDDACPLPAPRKRNEGESIRRMLAARRIAVVGLSDDPDRPSHGVAGYLQSAGHEIVPVNPNVERALGVKSYPRLSDVPGRIDVVNVFRRAEACPDVVREAVAIGAKGVWLQSGILSEESRRIAEAAGIDFVQNRCMMVEHLHGG